MNFLNGGLAGSGAVLISNPFDVVKIRLQLQGELAARGQYAVHYRGSLHAIYVIAKTEGPRALYKGLGPAMCFQIVMNGTRLGLFQTAQSNGWTKSKNGDSNFAKAVFWGSVAGVAGFALSSPLQLVKVQIQAKCDKSIAVGHQHQHSSTIDAYRTIYKKNGFLGLYAGMSSAMLQGAFASAAQLSSFTMAKYYLNKNEICVNSPIALAFLASCLSGVAVTAFMCPFDVVATRLFNQSHDAGSKNLVYKGVYDCIVKVYKHEGLFGFYKGYKAMYMRLAPQTTASLVIWDWLNSLQRELFKIVN